MSIASTSSPCVLSLSATGDYLHLRDLLAFIFAVERRRDVLEQALREPVWLEWADPIDLAECQRRVSVRLRPASGRCVSPAQWETLSWRLDWRPAFVPN